jgi:hypothetical protein
MAEIQESRKLGGSKGKSPKVGCSKSRVAKCRDPSRENMWQDHKVGPAWLTGGHALPGERSQFSVDFSRLRDLQDKSLRAQPLDLRSPE